MPYLLVAITLLLSLTAVAKPHDHSIGIHGMVLMLVEDRILASHMPMPHGKHAVQLVVELQPEVMQENKIKTLLRQHTLVTLMPQFVNVEQGSMALQLLVLGLVYALVALGCDIGVALLSGKLGRWLSQHPAAIRLQDKIAGGILVGLGVFIGYDSFVNEN